MLTSGLCPYHSIGDAQDCKDTILINAIGRTVAVNTTIKPLCFRCNTTSTNIRYNGVSSTFGGTSVTPSSSSNPNATHVNGRLVLLEPSYFIPDLTQNGLFELSCAERDDGGTFEGMIDVYSICKYTQACVSAL